MDVYRDRVSVEVSVIAASYRMGSVEVASDSSSRRAVRLYAGGWIISSAGGTQQLLSDEYVVRLAKRFKLSRLGLSEAKLYKGRSSQGMERVSSEDLVDLLETLVSAAPDGYGVEASVEYVVEKLEIEHPEGVAQYAKGYTDVVIAVSRGGSVASVRVAVLGFPRSAKPILRRLVEELAVKASRSARARSLTALEWGRKTIVLSRDAAAALLHELGHALESMSTTRLRLGAKLGTSIDVYDDPFYPLSPAWRPFDDEAVEARRRRLIEDGQVLDYLHTRETAALYGSEPGNAWGLFHRPVPGHSTLVLAPGDWRDSEVVEETREGLLVDQVVEAMIRSGVVTLIPETAWLVKRGEIAEAIHVSRIVIPLSASLKTVDAMSRSLWTRVSTEKGRLQAEAAPTIRLQAYVS